jgi:hypothetical protein
VGGRGRPAHQKKAQALRATLVFVDESGFALTPPVSHTWALRGQTPVVRHRLGRDHLTAIGLVTISPVRKRLGTYLCLQECSAKSEDFVHCLRQILRHHRGHVIVVWDNLGAHRSRAVREFVARHPRLSLEYLPPYAPELNPVDHLWGHMKRGEVVNHSAEDLDEVLAVVHGAYAHITPRHLRGFIRGTGCQWLE